MKFLPTLASIKKPPSPLRLLDVALLLSLLPHLSHLKFPMLVYLLVVMAVVMRKKEVSKVWQYSLTLFGLLSLISSFYTDFNFSDFSKFALYLSFLNGILIYAVSLQRLKGEINFYLAFSPAMLLVLSFFLHNSITMLFYMVFVLFSFMVLLLWYKMQTPLGVVIQKALSIFAISLPIVALLFVVFPRISFEKADYGFQDTLVKRSGHNGKMSLGSDAYLVPSAQVVMEVYFEKGLPKVPELYFRGTVLYVDANTSFKQLPKHQQEKLTQKREATLMRTPVSYAVTLYPHNEKWLYTLDLPLNAISGATLNDDYVMMHKKKVQKTFRYKETSYLSYALTAPLTALQKKAALQIDLSRDPESVKNAQMLKADTDQETFKNLNSYFATLDLEYTLKPSPFDASHPVDSFLYGSKKGYCVHFAGAYTYMARAAGLPARVVTGYMVDTSEALNNYLVVRQYSAHAWVEVYLKQGGWTRVETTSFAQRFSVDALQNLSTKKLTGFVGVLHEVNLRFMYVKYLIENWILEYSRVKQMALLEKLLNNVSFLITVVFYALLLLLISGALGLFFSQKRCDNSARCLLEPLYKCAKKEGFVKEGSESVHDFLERLALSQPSDLLVAIDKIYHELQYSSNKSLEKEKTLKKLVQEWVETQKKR